MVISQYVLIQVGMCQKVRQWISELLTSTRIAIIINGQPGDFFGVTRGLKQGDPLSPSLFAIMEEVLSMNLSVLVQDKKTRPMI